MKKNWKRIASLFLSVLLLLSMTVTPVMAAEGKAAPTEVKSCTSSGLWTTVLNLEFEDTTWMNAIDGVTVNEEAYKKTNNQQLWFRYENLGSWKCDWWGVWKLYSAEACNSK